MRRNGVKRAYVAMVSRSKERFIFKNLKDSIISSIQVGLNMVDKGNIKDTENASGGEYPTPRASAVAFILSLVLVVTVGTVTQLYALLPGLYLTEWLLILGPPLVLLKRKKVDVKECLSLRSLTVKHVFLGVLAGLGVSFLMFETVFLMERILGPHPVAEFIEKAFPTTWLGFIPWVFGMGFSAGFCEEVLFRGFIQNGLYRRWGAVKAVMTTTILFAVFHLDPWRIPATILFGLLAGYLLVRTSSLFTAMASHITVNSLAQVLAFTQAFPEKDVEWALVSVLSVVLILITLYVTEKTRRQQTI